MVYRFTLISDEVDDFLREIQIDPEATFYDFHKAILKSVNYTDDQMTSFFICDDDWEKEKEITLEEMNDDPEVDSWVMKDTTISELIEDEKQKLIYVFDYMLSGTPEDIQRIQAQGKLDEWCRDNIEWLQETFGKDNVVSAVLHMLLIGN